MRDPTYHSIAVRDIWLLAWPRVRCHLSISLCCDLPLQNIVWLKNGLAIVRDEYWKFLKWIVVRCFGGIVPWYLWYCEHLNANESFVLVLPRSASRREYPFQQEWFVPFWRKVICQIVSSKLIYGSVRPTVWRIWASWLLYQFGSCICWLCFANHQDPCF